MNVIIPSKKENNSETKNNSSQLENKFIVFAGESKDFFILNAKAKKISEKSGINYRNDLVYYNGKGMIVPDTSSDEMYRGASFPRRYDKNRISIEMKYWYFDKKILQ